ncbi:hypothetical protein b3_0143 [Synechococcus phage B3]|nr:hypothetical protein b3_0143 [Synechococcus phage B3]QGT54757.1 hypothetical protein b23_0142 [Synechococcus phage B23]
MSSECYKEHSVVINSSYGGFGLSNAAMDRLVELGYELDPNPYFKQSSWRPKYLGDTDIPRHHPLLVQVVRELGEKASGNYACLSIETVHGLYRIEDYDGLEHIVENGQDDCIAPAFY